MNPNSPRRVGWNNEMDSCPHERQGAKNLRFERERPHLLYYLFVLFLWHFAPIPNAPLLKTRSTVR
jgi:hypothetical protein